MDYCTLWPEGWWAACCQAHDAAYSAQIGKLLADERLQQCVSASLPDFAAAHPVMAGAAACASVAMSWVMYCGVRAFGGRFYRRARLS